MGNLGISRSRFLGVGDYKVLKFRAQSTPQRSHKASTRVIYGCLPASISGFARNTEIEQSLLYTVCAGLYLMMSTE